MSIVKFVVVSGLMGLILSSVMQSRKGSMEVRQVMLLRAVVYLGIMVYLSFF